MLIISSVSTLSYNIRMKVIISILEKVKGYYQCLYMCDDDQNQGSKLIKFDKSAYSIHNIDIYVIIPITLTYVLLLLLLENICMQFLHIRVIWIYIGSWCPPVLMMQNTLVRIFLIYFSLKVVCYSQICISIC